MAGPNPQITATVSVKDDASETLKSIARLAKQVAAELDKNGHLPKLPNGMAEATRAAERHAQAIKNITTAFKGLATAASAYAAIKLPHVAGEAFHEGVKLEHEAFQLKLAGIPEHEIEKARKQVIDLTRNLPNVSIEAGLESYKELRSVLKDIHEVPHMLPTILKAKSVLDSADPTGGMSKGLGFMVKGAEVAGIANNPERFDHFMDASVKAMQAMGKTINPEQIYELLKYEKAAAIPLTDKFQMTTALSLAQEMGGSTAGVAINQFSKQMIGGFQGNLHAAAKEFVAIGLANKADFELTKTGEIKGMKPGRHVTGSDVAQRDPFEYVQKYLLPALKAHGYDTQDKQLAEVRRLYPNSNAADMVSKLITQAESFENHAKLYDHALGINADLTRDAATQITALSTSLKDLAAVASGPIMGDLGAALNNASKGIRDLITSYSEWAGKHPIEAKAAVVGAGAATVGTILLGAAVTQSFLKNLLGGAALDKSAFALLGAADRLSAAAARLGAGAGSTAGKVATAAEGAAGGAAVTAAEIGAGVTASGIMGLGVITGAATAGAAGAVYGITSALAKLGVIEPNRKGDTSGHYETQWKGRYQVRTWKSNWDALDRDDITPGDGHGMRGFSSDFEGAYHPTGRGRSMWIADLSRPKPLYDAPVAAPVGWAGKQMAPGPAGPDLGGARSIPSAPFSVLQPQPVHVDATVTGDVTGEASLSVKVETTASPLLQSIVQGAQAMQKMALSGKLGSTMKGSNAAMSPVSAAGLLPTFAR